MAYPLMQYIPEKKAKDLPMPGNVKYDPRTNISTVYHNGKVIRRFEGKSVPKRLEPVDLFFNTDDLTEAVVIKDGKPSGIIQGTTKSSWTKQYVEPWEKIAKKYLSKFLK